MVGQLDKWDVIIIGGASAGLSSALYASRQGLNTLLITKDISLEVMISPGHITAVLSPGGAFSHTYVLIKSIFIYISSHI
jgi:thioredoxin reductase